MIYAKRKLIFAYLMLFVLSVDHKGDDGGGWVIYTIVTSFFLFYIAHISFNPFRSLRRGAERWVSWLMGFPLLYSSVPLFFSDLTFDSFVRASLPMIMALVFYRLAVVLNIEELLKLVRVVFYAGVLSAVFTLIFGFLSSGDGIDGIRYQIISPFSGALLAIILSEYCCGFKFRYIYLGVFVFILGVFLISATRGVLVAFVGAALVLSISTRFYKIVLFRDLGVLRLVVALSGVSLILLFVYPDVLIRLYDRITFSSESVGVDVTSLTRLIEIDAQLDALIYDWFSLVFGNGIGGKYVWSDAYNSLLSGYVGDVELQGEYTYVGHNFWVYSLFASGVFVGLFNPLLFLIVFLFSVRFYGFVFRSQLSGSYILDLRYLSVCLLFYFSFLIFSTVGGNPFVTRAGGALFGFFCGVALRVFGERKFILQVSSGSGNGYRYIP